MAGYFCAGAFLAALTFWAFVEKVGLMLVFGALFFHMVSVAMAFVSFAYKERPTWFAAGVLFSNAIPLVYLLSR